MIPFAFLPNLGMPELLIVAFVSLLIFGNRLPSVMRSLGKSVTEFKKGISGIEEELDQAVTSEKKPTPPTGVSAVAGRCLDPRCFFGIDHDRPGTLELELFTCLVSVRWRWSSSWVSPSCSSASGCPRWAGRWARGSSNSRRDSMASPMNSIFPGRAAQPFVVGLRLVVAVGSATVQRAARTTKRRSPSSSSPARPRRSTVGTAPQMEYQHEHEQPRD